MDHVYPIVKGGAHSPENIVGACQSCNSKKRDRLWPRENGALYEATGVPTDGVVNA